MTAILTFLAQVVPVVVTSAVAVLAVIAPLTKSNIDNTALDVLRFIENNLLNIFFPSLKNPAPANTSAPAPASAASK